MYTRNRIDQRGADPTGCTRFWASTASNLPKTRKNLVCVFHEPQPIVPNALMDTTCCGLGISILHFGGRASMQFLGCRKMLPYKWLWLMLSSSVASMKGRLRCETHGKNRSIRSFGSRSLCARRARAKVCKIFAKSRCLVLLVRPIDCFNLGWRESCTPNKLWRMSQTPIVHWNHNHRVASVG